MMDQQNDASRENIDLITILGLLVGNSFDYLKLFLPLFIFYKLYIKYHTHFKKSNHYVLLLQ